MLTSRVCPSCHSLHIRRAHKKGLLEKILAGLTGIHPYRCEECDARFLSRRVKPDKMTDEANYR
jgi:ribosomal protein L37AE/L43A